MCDVRELEPARRAASAFGRRPAYRCPHSPAAARRTKLPRAPPTAAPVPSLAGSPPAFREPGGALPSAGWSNRNDGKGCHSTSGLENGRGKSGRRGGRAARSAPARSRGRRVRAPAREPVLSPRPLGAFSPVNRRHGWSRSAGRHAGALQGEARGSAAGGGDPFGVGAWRAAAAPTLLAGACAGPRMLRPVAQRGGVDVGEFDGGLTESIWGRRARRRKEGT